MTGVGREVSVQVGWAWLLLPDSLGIPDTSFRGLSTRTARRVRRSKSVPAVARILAGTKTRGKWGLPHGVEKRARPSHHPCPVFQEQWHLRACVPRCPSTGVGVGGGVLGREGQELNSDVLASNVRNGFYQHNQPSRHHPERTLGLWSLARPWICPWIESKPEPCPQATPTALQAASWQVVIAGAGVEWNLRDFWTDATWPIPHFTTGEHRNKQWGKWIEGSEDSLSVRTYPNVSHLKTKQKIPYLPPTPAHFSAPFTPKLIESVSPWPPHCLTFLPLFSFAQLCSHPHHSTEMFCQGFSPIAMVKSPAINGFFSCPLVNSLIFLLTSWESLLGLLCKLCPLYQTEKLDASRLTPYRICPTALNTTVCLLLPIYTFNSSLGLWAHISIQLPFLPFPLG